MIRSGTLPCTVTRAASMLPATAATAAAPQHQISVSVESSSYSNAQRMAKSYLRYQAFSRSGLIHQLRFEGFSKSVATRAVDSLHIGWKTQAYKMAKQYLKYQAFSRKGLYHQLRFEGFTPAQAKYGVNKAY